MTAGVFLPLNSSDAVRAGVSFVVRVRGRDPLNLISAARAVVRSVNSNIPLASVRTLDEILDESMARTSFALVLLGIAAALALLLSLVGIYGVISYIVSQRTREIGVRMAVGADARDVRQMVLRQGMVLSGIGVVIGLAAAIGLARVMSSLLYGVEPSDPLTLGAATIVLVSVALVACYVPASRASRTHPVDALRLP